MSRNTNAKRNTTSNEMPSILLKTIHDEIVRNNENCTLTTKKMRARLRVEMRDIHIHNSTWLFTTSQRHDVRMMFDAKYRAQHERAQKRATSTRATPRKTRTKSNDVANVDDANANVNDDANA